MTIRALLACCVAAGLAVIVSPNARAEPPTFRITQVFSNLDGSLQYVELTETAGLNGQHRFAGLTLTVTWNGMERHYVFPHDLPTEQTAHLSIVVAASVYDGLPVGDPYDGSFYDCCYEAYFRKLPLRFLPTAGATLDFAGTDRLSYARLPTDGASSLYRDGTVQRAALGGRRCYTDAGCVIRRLYIAHSYISAIEYYNADRDHYFVTALADEIDAIDAGRVPGWRRTGEFFFVGGGHNTHPGLDQPVCRFYIPPDLGDSHVLSASAEECAAIGTRFPRLLLETTAAFHVAAPNRDTGTCLQNLEWNGGSALLTPIFRLWNQRSDSNHRYTTKRAIRNDMISRGYVSEGYGPLGVAMCVP